MDSTPYSTQSIANANVVSPQRHRLDQLGVFRQVNDPEFPHEVRPHWRASLELIERHVPVTKHLVKTRDVLYTIGQSFETLHLINMGVFKIVSLAADGRERSADLVFEGDWLGFDGIPTGQHSCTAVALDIGEVWALNYCDLLRAATIDPSLLHHALAAISAQLARNRDIALSLGTLSSEARVADFLLMWARSLAERGRRTDEINVRLSRSEIGDYLGIRLESVSRALCKLANIGAISFNERGRRDIRIPDLAALGRFAQSKTELGERYASCQPILYFDESVVRQPT